MEAKSFRGVMKRFFLLVVIFSFAFCFAKEIRFVSWNVETFFDGEKNGNEYSEFLKPDKWDEGSYKKRLKKLCEALKILDADVCVLLEIENKEILYDISNQMQDLSWKRNKMYKFSSFAKNEGSSIGSAVLSRFEIRNFSIHNVDAKVSGSQPSMRPVLKTVIGDGIFELNLYVNHWKSMSGGEEKSEIWRNWQESVLAGLVEDDIQIGKKNIVACGDFNRDVLKFYLEKAYTPSFVKLRHFVNANGEYDFDVNVKSCWFDENGNLLEPGSYYFRNDWSRIDNIFFTGEIEVKDFCALQNELWCTEEGLPDKYKIYSGSGFSDHLPLVCTLNISEN